MNEKKNTSGNSPLTGIPKEVWQFFFKISPLMICLIGFDQLFKAVNPVWTKVLGWSEKELLETKFIDLIHPEEAEATLDFAKKQRNKSEAVSAYENRYRCKDGSYRWLQWHAIPIQEHEIVFGIVQDITEQKAAEEELKSAHTNLNALLKNSEDYILISDRNGNPVAFNDAYASIIKRTLGVEMKPGLKPHTLLDDEEAKSWWDGLHERVMRGEVFREEFGYPLGEDDFRTFEFSYVPIMENDEVVGFTEISRDITERKQVEEDLRSEKVFNDMALNAQLDTFFLFEPDTGQAIRWNQAFNDITGYTDEEISGQKAPDSYYSPEDLKKAAAFSEEVLDTGSGTLEMDLICKDGRKVPTEYKVSVIRDEAGNPKQLISIGRDISQRKKTEEALKESEKKYRSIIESSPMGMHMYQLEADGRLVFIGANRAADTILGIDHSQFIGKTIEEAFPASAGTELVERYRKAASHGETWSVEQNTYEDDIISGTFEVRAFQTSPGKMTALFLDVTERKKAAQALKESEERFRSLSQATFEGIAITEEGVFIDVNKQLLDMTGFEKEELIGKKITDFVVPEDHQSVLSRVENKIQDLNEVQVICKDGRLINVEARPRVMEISGKTLRLTALRDVTKRKKAEEALRESEAKFRSIVESSPMGMHMYQYEPDGRLIFTGANPSADTILGVDNSQFIGMTIEEAFPPLVNTEIPQRYRDAAANGTPWYAEQISYDDSGIVGAFEVHAFQTSPGRMTALFLDITKRKQAEEEVRKLNDELEQRVANRTAELEASNQELEAFAYSISHDLRAPLRAINGFSEILQEEYDEALDEEAKGYLSRVQDGADRMNRLIDDLLALSRLGRKEMSFTTARLDQIAKRVFKDIAKLEPDRKIKFQVKGAPPVQVDESLIELALSNLIENAVKFTRNNETAKIEFGVLEKKDRQIFYVKDNGVGFDMIYADKIFSPFQRLHTDTDFEGTGIGLAIVQRIIQRHGGEIWIESKPGEGTTFFFTLKTADSRG